MATLFPIYKPTARTSEAGVNAVSGIVNDDFGWIFRRVHNETDFGIDGHIDVVDDLGGVTGQSLAVQIKTGLSYFRTETPASFTYYGEAQHFNYYINQSSPVVLIIHNPNTKTAYWSQFDPLRTEKTSTGWKTSISKRNVLSAETKSDFLEILGPAIDGLSLVEGHWAFTETLSAFESIHYAVDRHDVERGDASNIGAFFSRIEGTESLCVRFQGRVEISIAGYERDPRELWEIEEVRRWFAIADPVVKWWFFFCDTAPTMHGLKTYVLCQVGTKRAKIKHPKPNVVPVKYLKIKLLELFDRNWPRLNEMTDRLGMSIDENKRISYEIMDLFKVPHDA